MLCPTLFSDLHAKDNWILIFASVFFLVIKLEKRKTNENEITCVSITHYTLQIYVFVNVIVI